MNCIIIYAVRSSVSCVYFHSRFRRKNLERKMSMVIENRIAMFSMFSLYLFIIFCPRIINYYKLYVDEDSDKKNTPLVLSKLINGVKLEKIYE